MQKYILHSSKCAAVSRINASFVFSGRDPELLFKDAAKILRGRKSALKRAILDGKKVVSHQLLCIAEPSRDEVFRGRYAILFLKKLSEIYLADARHLGKGGDSEGTIAVMLVDISLGGAYAVILIFGGVFLLRTLKKQAVYVI